MPLFEGAMLLDPGPEHVNVTESLCKRSQLTLLCTLQICVCVSCDNCGILIHSGKKKESCESLVIKEYMFQLIMTCCLIFTLFYYNKKVIINDITEMSIGFQA